MSLNIALSSANIFNKEVDQVILDPTFVLKCFPHNGVDHVIEKQG